MIGQISDVLLRLTHRERVLVGLLVLFLFPAVLWLAVVGPLTQRRIQAEADLAEARSLNLWVGQRSLEMAQLQTAVQAAGPQPPIGLAGLEQALITAGLRPTLTGLSNGAEGGIDLRFDAVSFTDLMAFLSAQEPQWGYELSGFRIGEGTDVGQVRAEIHLTPQG